MPDPKDALIASLRERAECAEIGRDMMAREVRGLMMQLHQMQAPKPQPRPAPVPPAKPVPRKGKSDA